MPNDQTRRRITLAHSLTRRLLQFSRQEQFNAQNFDVNELILGLKDLLAKSLNNKIDFGVELSKNLPLIKVDKGDFEDAILNLVLNAKDAMETGGKLTIYSGIEKLSTTNLRGSMVGME